MTDQAHRQQSIDRAGYVSTLIQGEVIELADACVILADPRFPLSEQSEDLDDQDFAMVAVPWRVERVVLITQTCDLQITDHQNFLCQVAPVIEVGKTISNEALRGRRPGSAALPWFSETAVADLSKITSLERSLLVEKGLSGHPRSALESLHFAEAISRHFTRTALPNPINEALRQFLERIKAKHDKQSPEGKCISLIATLRIEVVPDLGSECPDLTILIVLETENLPLLSPNVNLDDAIIDRLKQLEPAEIAERILDSQDSKSKREAWTALSEKWIDDIYSPNLDDIGSLAVEVLSGDEISFTRLRNAPEIDLAYVSTRPRSQYVPKLQSTQM